MVLRVRIYARVSSAAQRERETIAGQLRTLRDYAKARKWTVLGEHIDDGVSASSGHLEQRLGLLAMLRMLENTDAVLVLDVDRLSRSEDLIERAAVLGALQRAQVKIAVVSTGSLHDPDDLTLTIQSFGAADWVKKHRARIIQGKSEAIARGGKPAGPTPLGYHYDRPTKKWSIDETKAPIVREVFQRIARGETTESVSRLFNARGVFRPRGGEWTRENVWAMVIKTTYKGRWVADKAKKLVVTIPAIVTEEQWAAANDRMARPGLRGVSRTKHVYLCERIARCGICGSRMVVLTKTPHRPAYYWCTQRRRPKHGEPQCELPMFRVDQVDPLLWDALRARIERPDLVAQALAERAQEGDDAQEWAKDLAVAEKAMARLEKAAASALRLHGRGLMTEAVLEGELQANARERQMFERQVAAAKSRIGNIAAARGRVRELGAALQRLREMGANATPEQRREVVRSMMDGGTHVIVMGPRPLEVTAFARLGDQADELHTLAASSRKERVKPVTLRVVVAQPGDTWTTPKKARR